MPDGTTFRGDAVVFQGERITRNEQGVWVVSKRYTGLIEPLKSFAAGFPLGSSIAIDQSGASGTADVTLGFLNGDGTDTAPIDKWEDDAEEVEKDLAYSDLAQHLSTDGQRFLKAYRNASTADEKDDIDADARGSLGPGEYDTYLGPLLDEVDRGVESVPVVYIVLKRTRTMSSVFVSQRRLARKQEFYSTNRLVEMESIPSDVANSLPALPDFTPDASQWGWRPRLSNRSFVGRGLVEEHSDWVFAAWSTTLYTYVS